MPQGPNLSPIPDTLPQPAPPPVSAQQGQQAFQPPPPPPDPEHFYGGKTAAIADVADKVLRGWMAGKYLGEQKAREKAATQIGTMKDAVDTAGQAYRAAVEGGDPKKIEAAGKVLQQQWGEYNDAREKYVIPPDMGKGQKKNVAQKTGDAVKGMFKPQGPELYLQAAITASKQIDPRQLYGPSKKDQQEGKLADLQVAGAERANAKEQRRDEADKRYESVLQMPDKDMKPEDKKFRDTYEQLYLGRTKEQLFQDQILDKVTGGQPLNDFEKTKAEQLGLVKPAVTSTQVHTIMGPGGKPVTQLIAIGPDGKMVGQPQSLPGTDYVPPDQAQLAGRVINAEVSAYARLLGKAHPEMDEQTRYSMALGVVAKSANPAMSWAMQNEQQDVMNRAILKLVNSHTRKSTDKETGQAVTKYDEIGTALTNHFATVGDDGRYVWNARMGDKSDPGWWSKLWGDRSTYGGYTEDQLKQYDGMIRSELRAELKRENQKLPDTMIDQMMPPAGFGQKQGGQPGGMQQAPPQPGQGMETPPPKPGAYTVTAPDGRVLATDISEEQKHFMESQPDGKGLKFKQNGMPLGQLP